MSNTHIQDAAASSFNSYFQLIFDGALAEYERQTKKDLLAHPLATRLQSCDSTGAILEVLREQVQDLNRSRSHDEKLTRWLDPTVNVLYAFSDTLGEGVSLAFPPAKVIFAGIGVLLSAARDVRASQDTLVDIFERIEFFFRRLVIHIRVQPTPEMMYIIVKIMVEVLSILGIATKEINEGRTKRYLRRLVGKTDIEDALKRLDKLTQEEARMATTQVLITANITNDRVKALNDKLDQEKQNQLQKDFCRWLSPPDPSTNHNTACGAHRQGATWFFQGSIFSEWKSTGSLLWIYGKPGSGKSVLCSSIIKDIASMCEAGQALMSYFYFDFQDVNKQNWHDLIHSLLTRLSACSGPCYDLLSRLYSAHGIGAHKPGDEALTGCLKEMLKAERRPIYIIIDALDECPNTPGIPSPRECVLQLVTQLVNLRLPNLRICVTSRLEFDIVNVLEPLASLRVSLHDQSGQQKDIAEYVRSVVYSNSQDNMNKWRTEDKELVIETLSERADGMFRWAYCQLERLRFCLPSSVRCTLEELPESLDETYRRILKELKPNQNHAHRLLQCLVVAIRPLRVEELAEVLAVDFNDEEGIPRLNAGWLCEDQEQALLSSCSSLITIVKTDSSRVVQFSHFSVKEFLTSPRLATPSRDLSHYYIDLKAAHTTLMQAWLGVLLPLDIHVYRTGVGQRFPLVQYAAQHWVSHAQSNGVSRCIQKGMEYLFDLDKPHFATWLAVYDIDTRPDDTSILHMFTPSVKSDASPLYYAALCGFHDLVERLIAKYPQNVNANGGYYVRPVLAALAGEHFQTAQLLRHNGADPNVRGNKERTPLHSAAHYGHFAVVQKLIEYDVNIDCRDAEGMTPLCLASSIHLEDPYVIQSLLAHNANVNAQAANGSTPLHFVSRWGFLGVARMLLERGANLETKDTLGMTPLHCASRPESLEVARLLLKHRANVEEETGSGETALHRASRWGSLEVVRLLLEHGANVKAKDKSGETPLHRASRWGSLEVARLLLEHGANVEAKDKSGETPLHRASRWGSLEVAHLLLERGANVEAKEGWDETPLHRASRWGSLEVARLLLGCGANREAKDRLGKTPLHCASRWGSLEVARLLLEHGANVKVQDRLGMTPLQAGRHENIVRLLLEHGAR